ncbi:hypothetical protein H7Y40_02035, partial [Pedobacter sp.]|nr:hypothetical protein [Candidatus Saccharibacteria bacterium]
YKATGTRMKALKPRQKKGDPKKPSTSVPQVVYVPVDDRPKKLYVHVKDPKDQDRLLKLKQSFSQYPGSSEIILVLGNDKESAVRLPFKTDPSAELTALIAELYGSDCVVLK